MLLDYGLGAESGKDVTRVISGIMYRTPVIIENKPLQGEARHLRKGVDMKTGRETEVAALSSSLLFEGAGRGKLSPAGLSFKSNTYNTAK